MARSFSGKEVIKVLIREFGFRYVRARGSHVKLKKKTPLGELITIVPLHRDLAKGTLRGVLDLAKIDYKEFLKKV